MASQGKGLTTVNGSVEFGHINLSISSATSQRSFFSEITMSCIHHIIDHRSVYAFFSICNVANYLATILYNASMLV